MSDQITLTEKQKKLIEQLGIYHEKSGLSPASGRIKALLTVSPVLELSFDQIRETLQLSKSATSNSINLLMSMGAIDYITHPGDRKRFFRSKIGNWRDTMKQSFRNITNVADLLEEILIQRPNETEEFNKNLEEVISFMRYFKKEIPSLYKKWDKSE
ncbi:MAG: hypothetical protein CMP59_05195 [Flavobacteriales bacterium]|nr:hypothetical protein [Flavobacteriales bacterium]|tara:strand:+ start:4070 stop:4540 length:471 start_codon:yes stop_codon:yes gene_type:complete